MNTWLPSISNCLPIFVAAAKLDQGGDVSLEAAKLIALELFREYEISLGRAAELCRMPIQAFMDYAGEHGAPLHYGWKNLSRTGVT